MPATTSSPCALIRNSPKNSLRPGGRVAREADAGARTIAGVAEHHHLHVDGGADGIGDVVDAAVFLRARVVPRAEDRVARAACSCIAGILREVLLGLVVHDLLVARDHLAQRRLVEVGVERRAAFVLHRLELVLERRLGNLEHDAAEHLDEPAVAVEGEPAVPGARLEAFDRRVVQAEIEDRVHHPGHREFRARPHRDEQRVVRRAERRAGRRSRACVRCRLISASISGVSFRPCS